LRGSLSSVARLGRRRILPRATTGAGQRKSSPARFL